MTRNTGLTLIELLVAAAVSTTVVVAVGRAFIAGLDQERLQVQNHADLQRLSSFEDRLIQIIRSARLSGDPTNPASYFIGTVGQVQSTANSQTQTAPSSMQTGSSGSASPIAGANGDLSDTLTMTVAGSSPSQASIASTDDFQTLNTNFGPQGGTTEVSLTVNSQWDNGQHKGLFIRTQIPADGDPTQGGSETLFDPDVRQIGFEFFDGLDWQPVWNTQTQTTARIPAAVRVTYTLVGDIQGTEHVLIVRLPLSNVTATNPVAQGGNVGP